MNRDINEYPLDLFALGTTNQFDVTFEDLIDRIINSHDQFNVDTSSTAIIQFIQPPCIILT